MTTFVKRRVAAAIATALVAASCGGGDPTAAPDTPTLEVCVDPLDKPMQFEDTENPGEYLGMAVEVISEIAEREGTAISWKPTAHANTLRDLTGERCDVALARFADDTPDVRYTRPFLAHQIGIARLISGPDYPSLDFVVDRRIGARRDSEARQWLQERLPGGASIVSLPSTGDLVAALKASRVDSLRPTAVEAIVDDWSALAYRVKDDPELVIFQNEATGLEFTMAVRSNDRTTFGFVDGGLEELMTDGTVDDIAAELFFPDDE